MVLRRRGTMRLPVFLTILLIAAPFFAYPLSAQQLRRYIVELRDEPVIGHLAPQGSAEAFRLQMQSPATASYRARLRTRQAAVRQRLETFAGAHVDGQLDTVLNALIVSMRPEDVAAAKQDPDVADVVPSIRYHKLLDAAVPLANIDKAWASSAVGGESKAGAGVRVAVIDTGIDINHPMFQDNALVIPSGFPRATTSTPICRNTDQNFTNSKVIVARNYVSLLDNPDQNCDAMDRDGHGTFVAGIAAGERVTAPLASISGAAPKAFLGSYKVFGTPGSNDDASLAAIVKAVDDAVNDGMNIINMSLGATTGDLPSTDPLDQAVDKATRAGILVVVAAGNDGPGTGTITSPGTSPSALTVGASTNSRFLANPLTISANVAVPAALQKVGALFGTGPKISANVAATLLDVIAFDPAGTGCSTLPSGSLNGQIALVARGLCNFSVKIQNAANAGAIAAIIFNNQVGQPPVLMDVGTATKIPSAMISNAEGVALRQFLAASGTSAQATLGAERTAIPTPANRMAPFSAGGPSTDFGLKPDLVAPGTSIYSAAQGNSPSGLQFDLSGFTSFSGTSFSSPLVAGAAALLKQARPTWTPAQIKSAIVNTASKAVTSPVGTPVTVLSSGNGLLNASDALASPLVVSPVSVSFGTLPQGVTPGAVNLTVTNIGDLPDNFTVTVTPGLGAAATVTPSQTSFSLSPSASTLLSISITPPAQPATYEGYIAIHGQISGSSVTVAYWGSTLVPSVNPSGVVSAAGAASSPTNLAAGQLISIYGNNLANSTESAVTLPLPNSLGGAAVSIGGKPAPLLYASPTQFNAQIPWELAGNSSATVVVSLNGTTSNPITIFLAPAAPAIFTSVLSGGETPAVLHTSDGSLVTASNPARANEFLEIFATGLGATLPPVSTGAQASSDPIANTSIVPTATIGGIAAPVSFSGLAPGFVGLNQVNVRVPNGLQPGVQTVILTSNGVASNSVNVSVGP